MAGDAPAPGGDAGAFLPPVSDAKPVIGGGASPGKARRKSKWLVLVSVAVVLLLAGGGAVYGLYLPNTPSGVWKAGLKRSGDALDGLLQTATKTDKLKAYSTATLKGALDATMEDVSYKGSFNTTFDKDSLDGGLDVTLKSGTESRTVGVKVLSEAPKTGLYPDVYFKVTGFKDLGYDALLPGIANYDGKWIKIDAAYFKSIAGSFAPQGGSDTTPKLSSKDAADAARALMAVTKQYVFTTDKDKAILVQKSYLGKEKMDGGITAYHYKVGLNNDHTLAYCIALGDAFLSTHAYKAVTGSTSSEIADAKKANTDSCKDTAKNSEKDAGEFELWMDTQYKLVHKLRFTDTEDKNTYVDVGQLYKGGNKLSAFVTYHSKTNDTKFTSDINLDTSTTNLKLTSKDTGDSPYDLTATLDATVSKEPVTITPPTGATSFTDLLKSLGLDGFVNQLTQEAGASPTSIHI